MYVKKHLQGGLPEAYTNSLMTFSAQTSANMTQVSRERGGGEGLRKRVEWGKGWRGEQGEGRHSTGLRYMPGVSSQTKLFCPYAA